MQTGLRFRREYENLEAGGKNGGNPSATPRRDENEPRRADRLLRRRLRTASRVGNQMRERFQLGERVRFSWRGRKLIPNAAPGQTA
jgi:hypothetical protein